MAENLGSKHQDIGEVKLWVTLENIIIFEMLQTKEFFVRGNPWYISFKKNKKNNADHLSISLCSNAKHESHDSFVIGSFKLKMVPSGPGLEVLKRMHSAQVFTAHHTRSTLDIPWKDLINFGCIENGECKIQIKMQATPLQNAATTDWVTFETVGTCLRKTYRITVKKSNEFIGVSTPEFIFNEILFRVSVIPFGGYLFIKIHDVKGSKCTLSLTSRLISFDPKVLPLVEESKNYELSGMIDNHFFKLVSCEQLNDTAKSFIRNNSFVFEIDMNVEDNKEEEPKAKKHKSSDQDKKWTCPICFEDLEKLPLSSLLCGHINCTACLTRTVQQHKRCPKCNAPAALCDLRKAYLP